MEYMVQPLHFHFYSAGPGRTFGILYMLCVLREYMFSALERAFLFISRFLLVCNSFIMTYVGVKCLTRHCSVLRDTRTRGTT